MKGAIISQHFNAQLGTRAAFMVNGDKKDMAIDV